jgi:hypothetical protein
LFLLILIKKYKYRKAKIAQKHILSRQVLICSIR